MFARVTLHSFRDAFYRAGRDNQFSIAALDALFEYYESLEDSLGQSIELDVVAICCEWAEYDSAIDAAHDLGYVADSESEALSWLCDNCGAVIHLCDTVLVNN